MEIRYYLNGIEVNRPLNYKELSIELNYDLDDSSTQAVSLTEFEWGIGSQVDPSDSAKIINNFLANGLIGGVGVFEGLPMQIELTQEGTTYLLFDGYLDCSTAIFDCDRIVTQAVEKGKIDFLNEVADSFSFAYLYEETNTLNDSDFIPIPYILSELPNNREAFMSLISLFLIGNTITEQLTTLSEKISELAGVDPVALGGKLGGLVIRIIYISGLFLAAYKLIRQIINLLIQPLKYHKAMRVTRLCEVACDHLGYTFESSILYSQIYQNMCIIPNKYTQKVNDDDKDKIFGFLNPSNTESFGYYNGTFGDLLRNLKEMFNAKIIINGNVLRLEREDFNNQASNYIIPPVDQTAYTLNYEDFKANYSVRFATDINDKNTIQRYEGVETQRITTPKGINNKDMVLMKGLTTRSISLARCTRKETLTIPELALAQLAQVVDNVANTIVNTYNNVADTINSVLGAGTAPTLEWENLSERIENRVGVLLMENDFIEQQKIGIFDITNTPSNNKVSQTDELYINSFYLYNLYHYLRTFVSSGRLPNANQYKLYEANGVPFCFKEYELMRNNNILQDSDLRSGKLISLRWNVEDEIASINYKINELYTNNLEEKLITPDGK